MNPSSAYPENNPALQSAINDWHPRLEGLFQELGQVIIGQRAMMERLVMALIVEGHLLVEGVPGLAKTTAIRALAQAVHLSFQRVQFTPDLLPSDIIGTEIYSPQESRFSIKKGPLFANLILADEINRAPAKVQSALLEAMQEKQVTIGGETLLLPRPFLVMATQNPVEQEGTYALPEAELDRFFMKVIVNYPTKEEEIQIVQRMEKGFVFERKAFLKIEDLMACRKIVQALYVDPKIYSYLTDLCQATRHPMTYGLPELVPLLRYGVSPRGSICLAQAARVQAFFSGRAYVTPQDIKSVAKDVLRHRLVLSYEAMAEDTTADQIVQQVLDRIAVP